MCLSLLSLPVQEWKPRWGYKRVDDPKQEWLVELPADAGECLEVRLTGAVHVESA